MCRKLLPLVFIILFSSCVNRDNNTSANTPLKIAINQEQNLLTKMSEDDMIGYEWMNAPENIGFLDGSIKITSKNGTDFFTDPESGEITATAPFLFKEVTEDFVATSLVKPDFSDIWNAAALMVYIDSANWVKFAFENSDATGKSIVSVVTRGTSDDANGPILNSEDSIWLRIIRKQNVYAMHWSKNGVDFKMARLTALPSANTVKIGLESQCPVGKSATNTFQYFSLEYRTVEDLRAGL